MRYGQFAYIFDTLMADVDYGKWMDYLEDIFIRYSTKPKLILDLACGTGNITTEAAKRGYEMIGLDMSPEMLSIARQKSIDQELDILFLNQDMAEFELYGTVDAIVCCMDGVNYITQKRSLTKMFKLVNNYLNPNGLFIFDIRSEYELSDVECDNTFVEDTEDITYIWENEFDSKRKVSNMKLTFFAKEGEQYNKFYEHHQLRAYSINEIELILKAAKLEKVGCFEDFTFKGPGNKPKRIFFVAEKV